MRHRSDKWAKSYFDVLYILLNGIKYVNNTPDLTFHSSYFFVNFIKLSLRHRCELLYRIDFYFSCMHISHYI